MEDLKKVVAYGIEAIRKDTALFLEFSSVFFRYVTPGTICLTCPGGFDTGFYMAEDLIRKKTNIKPEIKMSNDSKFKFKAGKTVYSFLSHAYYSEANLTDEIALRLLKESTNNLVHFESYPANWQELIGEKTVKAATAVTAEPVSETEVSTDETTEGEDQEQSEGAPAEKKKRKRIGK